MAVKDLVAKLRREYRRGGLDEKKALQDPFEQFTVWFNEAVKLNLLDANAFALATATPDGKPSIRYLLLKDYNNNGFVFYSNYESRKGLEINSNPFASMLFFWGELNRQIRIEGKIEKVTKKESEDYFKTRPLKSRLGAWASHQSQVIKDRNVIIKSFLKYLAKFQTTVPLPPYWGGYRLIPDCFEFWQGKPNRLHDRLRYRLDNGNWIIERLAP
jgi:pyridoxamine 5'-phosphate oxidase